MAKKSPKVDAEVEGKATKISTKEKGALAVIKVPPALPKAKVEEKVVEPREGFYLYRYHLIRWIKIQTEAGLPFDMKGLRTKLYNQVLERVPDDKTHNKYVPYQAELCLQKQIREAHCPWCEKHLGFDLGFHCDVENEIFALVLITPQPKRKSTKQEKPKAEVEQIATPEA